MNTGYTVTCGYGFSAIEAHTPSVTAATWTPPERLMVTVAKSADAASGER